MSPEYDAIDPLDALFSQPAKSLESRIGLLEQQITSREALNQQIQSEIEFNIDQERRRLYRFRYSIDMTMPRHHQDTIKLLKQQMAIENVSAWKDVAFLERLKQEAKAEHARERTRSALLRGDKSHYNGGNR